MRTLEEIQEKFPRSLTRRYRNRTLKPALSSVDCFKASFLVPKDNPLQLCDGSDWHGCDIRKMVQFFNFLQNKCLNNNDLERTVKEAIQELISNLPKKPTSKEELRLYLMIPACHLIQDIKVYESITCPFARSVKNLCEQCQQTLDDWLKAIPLNYFRRLAQIFKVAVCHLAPKWINYTGKDLTLSTNLESCLWLLDKICRVNEARYEKLPEMFFCVPELAAYSQFIIKDFALYYLLTRIVNPAQFHLCKFPFLFNGELKHILLGIANWTEMVGSEFLWSISHQSLNHHTPAMAVDRRNIVEDTMMQMQCMLLMDKNAFKRQIMILFKGENDHGPGICREFFTLTFQKLLSPSCGLFTRRDKSACAVWFQQKETDLRYFHFAGFMLGLALYYSQFISLPFSTTVFKKLLGKQTDFNDLKEVRPEVAKNLCFILDTEQAEDLDLFFEVTYKSGVETITTELCENGSNIPVTDNNKNDYVRLMVDFYLNKETAKEFEQFHKGFYEAYDSEVLQLLRIKPSELRSVFIGHEKIDTALLEKNAIYEGKYNQNCQTIRHFWEIIHSLSQDDLKRFVYFLTGSERIPFSGFKIFIHPRPALAGENIEDVMPEALTCYPRLLLPDIPDKERLQERLLSAMNASPEFTNADELFRRLRVRDHM